MNAGAREQVLEHELERHLHLVHLGAQVSQDTQTNEGRHQKAVQCSTGMNAGAREQVLEHELERHLHLVSLPILCQSVHQRDVDVAHQTEVAFAANTLSERPSA